MAVFRSDDGGLGDQQDREEDTFGGAKKSTPDLFDPS